MSKAKIFAIFVAVDLAIVGGILWGIFHHVPVRQCLVPGIVLFFLNGVWLLWMTIRGTKS
jgi:hypothetical protein